MRDKRDKVGVKHCVHVDESEGFVCRLFASSEHSSDGSKVSFMREEQCFALAFAPIVRRKRQSSACNVVLMQEIAHEHDLRCMGYLVRVQVRQAANVVRDHHECGFGQVGFADTLQCVATNEFAERCRHGRSGQTEVGVRTAIDVAHEQISSTAPSALRQRQSLLERTASGQCAAQAVEGAPSQRTSSHALERRRSTHFQNRHSRSDVAHEVGVVDARGRVVLRADWGAEMEGTQRVHFVGEGVDAEINPLHERAQFVLLVQTDVQRFAEKFLVLERTTARGAHSGSQLQLLSLRLFVEWLLLLHETQIGRTRR